MNIGKSSKSKHYSKQYSMLNLLIVDVTQPILTHSSLSIFSKGVIDFLNLNLKHFEGQNEKVSSKKYVFPPFCVCP